jgi:hypothetical protein
MGLLPFSGQPAEVGFVDLLAAMVENPPVSKFFGRTADCARARAACSCDHVFALYSAEREGDASIVENTLRTAFARHQGPATGNCHNGNGKGGCLYVAVWVEK